MRRLLPVLAMILIVLSGAVSVRAYDPSYSASVPVDTTPLFPGGKYDQAVPKPNDFLLRPLGEWPLRYHELEAYLKALDGKSPRVKIETHGTTHEGRKLYNVFISSEENIRNLDKIRADMAAFADPKTAPRDAEALIGKLPAVAWMAYSIHGDECSGVDAALAAIYELAASQELSADHMLERLVIIIDPSQNPDGRERYLSMLETYRGSVPNYNMEALEHRGHWPWGRGNHYWFDMNRDWALATQPETESRLKTILDWHPQLVVDAHELEADGTFLTNPPREPVNYNIPESVRKWWKTFGQEQGAAFDQQGWPHYSGEWFEAWYPGYGDFWPSFSGSIGILYEQARVGGGMIKQSGDYLLTYHEAVHHQLTATFANLVTLSNHRDDIMRDYRNTRIQVIDNGRKSGLAFVFPPAQDVVKQNKFVHTLLAQGIEVQKTTADCSLSSATDITGNKVNGLKLPAGTYVVSTAQVQGALAKAILEFDPKLKVSFLEEERRYVQKKDESRMYDVSTWSLPLSFGLKAYSTT
ncbi:MAG: peptidase, partial [candidate division Zixibacteria bacterium]|nr:peptidase [candidate division Zixibacteria bacterium]